MGPGTRDHTATALCLMTRNETGRGEAAILISLFIFKLFCISLSNIFLIITVAHSETTA